MKKLIGMLLILACGPGPEPFLISEDSFVLEFNSVLQGGSDDRKIETEKNDNGEVIYYCILGMQGELQYWTYRRGTDREGTNCKMLSIGTTGTLSFLAEVWDPMFNQPQIYRVDYDL